MLLIIGILLNIIGIVGIVVPALPGILLNYISLVLLYIVKGKDVVSINMLIVFGLITFLVNLLDYILPYLGAKKFGASRTGIIFAAIGMLIGIIFFPPVGIFLGLLIGAFTGELVAGKNESQALKASLATFLGSLASMAIKLSLALIMMVYFFWNLLLK